jgi:hypothetical protein
MALRDILLGPKADPIMLLVQGSAARKAAAELRLKYYADQQSEDLLSAIRQRWSRPEDFRLFQVNIVRKIVNKRAMVYKTAPVRTFSGMDQAAGEALYSSAGVNVALKKANRLVKLCKSCALQVRWSGTQFTIATITPNVLDVVADDPIAPERIVVTRPGEKQLDTTYSDWTAETFQKLDWRGKPLPVPGNEDGRNPYGVLPFVPVFDAMPDGDFFLEGGADLVEAQRAVNVALVNLWRSIELQSHGQAWATGLPAGDAVRTGPDRAITLPEGGSFGFASPGTPIEEVLAAIEFVIKQTAVANDLAANTFEIDQKAQSGTAKAADIRDLLESRQDDVELWRGYEARLFEVIKRVVNTHQPGTIPEGASVSVDFGEVTDTISESDRLDAYQRRVDLGIWSPIDCFMADNPDIRDRSEAMRILTERREESAVLGVGGVSAGPSFSMTRITA